MNPGNRILDCGANSCGESDLLREMRGSISGLNL